MTEIIRHDGLPVFEKQWRTIEAETHLDVGPGIRPFIH